MSFEFHSIHYPTRCAMLAAIVEKWITAGGRNSAEEVTGILAVTSDEILAETCIDGWELDQPIDEGDPGLGSWMAVRDFTTGDLIQAFANYRVSHG